MTGGTEALDRIVVASVAVTARALAAVAPELTFLQWRALALLAEVPPATIGAIADRIGASSSATSRLVGRLESRKLVATAPDQEDRRATRVSLTADGATIVRKVLTARRAILAQVTIHPRDGVVLDRLATDLSELDLRPR
jgi:DNA-binding MarR family transcriptional regulator